MYCFQFFFASIYIYCGKGNRNVAHNVKDNIKIKKIDGKNVSVVDNENVIDNSKKLAEKKGVVENDEKPTMYERLYDNIVLSAEEKKLVHIDSDSEKEYKGSDSKWTTFGNIKYANLKWNKIKKSDFGIFDSFKKKMIIQDLGVEGSPCISLIPMAKKEIGLTFGYTCYNTYEADRNNIVFFDTKMPLGDVYATFNLDYKGFRTNIKTYYSANKNIHIGISADLNFKEHVLKTDTKIGNGMMMRNFPMSVYFMYKNNAETTIGLINVDFINYVHSDCGGVFMDRDNFINVEDKKVKILKEYRFNPEDSDEGSNNNMFKNMMIKHHRVVNLLGYFQYKFKKMYGYVEYIGNFESNKIEFNFEKEEKEEIENDVSVKKIKLVDNKIEDATKNHIFQEKEGRIDAKAFINNDGYRQHKIEIGVKDNIEYKLDNYLNWSVYYAFSVFSRGITNNSYESLNLDNVKKNTILKREYYFDPITLGGAVSIFGIKFMPQFTLSSYNPCFKVYIDYLMKYFKLEFCVSRSQIPLIYREYICYSREFRHYDKKNKIKKLPYDIYFSLKCMLGIDKEVFGISVEPFLKGDVSWNKLYFVIDEDTNSGDKVSVPRQVDNSNLPSMHFYFGLDSRMKFHRCLNLQLIPVFNIYEMNDVQDVKGDVSFRYFAPLFNLYFKAYYLRAFDDSRIEMSAGMEMFWRTSYMANVFDSVVQQFSRQNGNVEAILGSGIPNLGIFGNFRVGNLLGSLKMNIFNMIIPSYVFSSPNYASEKEIFTISLKYLFF